MQPGTTGAASPAARSGAGHAASPASQAGTRPEAAREARVGSAPGLRLLRCRHNEPLPTEHHPRRNRHDGFRGHVHRLGHQHRSPAHRVRVPRVGGDPGLDIARLYPRGRGHSHAGGPHRRPLRSQPCVSRRDGGLHRHLVRDGPRPLHRRADHPPCPSRPRLFAALRHRHGHGHPFPPARDPGAGPGDTGGRRVSGADPGPGAGRSHLPQRRVAGSVRGGGRHESDQLRSPVLEAPRGRLARTEGGALRRVRARSSGRSPSRPFSSGSPTCPAG